MSERISLYDDDIGEVLYIDHMGTDKRIVDAARVSFGRDLITEDFSDRVLLVEYRKEVSLKLTEYIFAFVENLYFLRDGFDMGGEKSVTCLLILLNELVNNKQGF